MEDKVIEHNIYLNILMVLRNCISLICFTILAIIFNKWWIVFFAILFTSFIDKDKKERVDTNENT